MKILIAEDEAVSRKVLQRTLQRWGYDVVAAENGAVALEAFQSDTFSLVITDWMMPEMDGLQLVRKIREMQSDDYVYIILLTAKTDKADLIAGMDTGADDFISKPFDKDELRVRVRAGERVVQLEQKLSARNAELEAFNERMRLELEAAAEIQKSLLPQRAPDIPALTTAWRYKPCDELGGDILNAFKLDERRLGFYVLDVSGHGVSAALLAVTLSRMLSPVLDQASLLKKAADAPEGYTLTPPAEVANQLNKRFQIDVINGQFFTMIYGILDPHERCLRYVSCGHPGIIRVDARGASTILKAASLPIGFLEENRYEEVQLKLTPGDRLYLYSDGIPEAENPEHELFGAERMRQCLQESHKLPLEKSLDILLHQLEGWCQGPTFRDDVTVLGIELNQER